MRTIDSDVLEAALDYVSRGIPVFPVHRPTDDGCSCGKRSCSQQGKHPATQNGFKDASLEPVQIKRWFSGKFKGYNIGALCGVAHVCLDVDPKNKGLASFEVLTNDLGKELPTTWLEETGEDKDGNRGRHHWFAIPRKLAGEELSTHKPIPGYRGVDFLAVNQYAIVAPSLHKSGVRYETTWPIEDVVEAPAELLSLIETVKEELGETPDLLTSKINHPTGVRPGPEVRHFLTRGEVPPGEQNSMIKKASVALWGLWASLDEAVEVIWEAIQKCDWESTPWTENQVHQIVARTYKQQIPPLDSPVAGADTDLARAHRIHEHSRGFIKCVWSTDEWLQWNATRWETVDTEVIKQIVDSYTRKLLREAAFIEDDQVRAQASKQAYALQRQNNIANCISATRRIDGVGIDDRSKLNRGPMLLNATNCIVDLRTGETKDQRPEDLMTYQTRADYRPEAKSKLWEDTIDQACGGDKDLMELFQVAMGYAITGETREDAFFYLYGPGGTGKTTIMEAMLRVLGDYGTTADPETFMISSTPNPGGARADLASLESKRFVVSTEIASGSKFSAAAINRLTGRDTISVRVPYGRRQLTFKPQWTLLFAANHFPTVPGASKNDGFWRRVKVLPFEHKIEKMNAALPHLLAQRDHAEAILAWLVAGAVKWWQLYGSEGQMIKMPDVVEGAVRQVQYEADQMNGFYDLLEQKPGAKVSKKDLFKRYLEWCNESGIERQKTQAQLTKSMKEALGVKDKQTYHDGNRNVMVWLNLEYVGPRSGSITIKGARKGSARPRKKKP